MKRGKKIALAVALVAAVIAVGAIFIVNRVRNDVRDAYASEWVAGDIIEYMKSHAGGWPRSWSDLRPIHDRYVSAGKCPWSFEMLQERVVVDWQADPKRLAAMPEISNAPPFRVVALRSGRQTYWQGMEPNRMIHEWLREQ